MKMRRPRTLLGMVLMGLAFVTVPLLVAVGNAMIKLGELAAESESVLADSAMATRENQRLANLLERMERTSLQYFELQNVVSTSEHLTLYDRDQAAFEGTVATLRSIPSETPIRDQLARLTSLSQDVHRLLRAGATEDAISERFGLLTEATRVVGDGMRTATNDRLATLQENTLSAQQEIAWLSAALIPGALVLVGLFLLLVGILGR
jgi:hypothetical protein